MKKNGFVNTAYRPDSLLNSVQFSTQEKVGLILTCCFVVPESEPSVETEQKQMRARG